MMLTWQDSIRNTINSKCGDFWHYKFPRCIGSSQFLVDFGTERTKIGESVALICLTRQMNRKINDIDVFGVFDIPLGIMGRMYDWVLMDCIGYCPVERIKEILSFIAPLNAKVLWIDSVEGTEIGGQAIKF